MLHFQISTQSIFVHWYRYTFNQIFGWIRQSVWNIRSSDSVWALPKFFHSHQLPILAAGGAPSPYQHAYHQGCLRHPAMASCPICLAIVCPSHHRWESRAEGEGPGLMSLRGTSCERCHGGWSWMPPLSRKGVNMHGRAFLSEVGIQWRRGIYSYGYGWRLQSMEMTAFTGGDVACWFSWVVRTGKFRRMLEEKIISVY